jgi:DNA-binding response OmpR family regulator
MTRILVVDDEPQIVRALHINLRARHYDVDSATDGTSALRAASRNHPDLVVLDLGLPDMLHCSAADTAGSHRAVVRRGLARAALPVLSSSTVEPAAYQADRGLR